MTSSIATDAEDGAITADAKYIAGSPGAARATASETGAESGDITTGRGSPTRTWPRREPGRHCWPPAESPAPRRSSKATRASRPWPVTTPSTGRPRTWSR